jgi:Mg2+/citrate symporter
MNQKQLSGVANSRAWETLKPYRWFLTGLFILLYLVAIWYANMLPLAINGVILVVGYLYIYQKTNKIQSNIIHNQESQSLSDADLRGLAGDKAAKTRRYTVYMLLSIIICLIPMPYSGVNPMPLCFRFPIAILGILSATAFILWNRNQIKSLKEQIKKELD